MVLGIFRWWKGIVEESGLEPSNETVSISWNGGSAASWQRNVQGFDEIRGGISLASNVVCSHEIEFCFHHRATMQLLSNLPRSLMLNLPTHWLLASQRLPRPRTLSPEFPRLPFRDRCRTRRSAPRS